MVQPGLMQRHPLLLSSIIIHAARHHPKVDVISVQLDKSVHRTDYATIEYRSRRLLSVLTHALKVEQGDRIATLAWNGYRHLELYWAVSGMGAVCHTVNPRLDFEDIAFIMNDAADTVLFADLSFVELANKIVPHVPTLRHVVLMCAAAECPDLPKTEGVAWHIYETLMDASSEASAWPVFDENAASVLCYTSGTTGKPKGVLYSHRATVLHAMAANFAECHAFSATDRVLLCTSMYHATAWGMPYCTAMVGAALILPGRHLDGASLARILNDERVTFSGGVPTIWLGVLQHLQMTGARPETLKRLLVAGSACPPVLIDGFGAWGVNVFQAWGMTETTPLVTYHAPLPATLSLSSQEDQRLRLKQGRTIFGADTKITDEEGRDLPRDGVAFGDFQVRGHWVCHSYLNRGVAGAADAEGWLHTGDVATIDPNGYVEMVDRSKDVIKSGGEWISTIQLENLAASHKSVAEAAVIGVHHPKWMERPLLLVVPRENEAIVPEEVLRVYEGKVARWWVPDRLLVVNELPHTATGKLNKRVLRERYADALEAAP